MSFEKRKRGKGYFNTENSIKNKTLRSKCMVYVFPSTILLVSSWSVEFVVSKRPRPVPKQPPD